MMADPIIETPDDAAERLREEGLTLIPLGAPGEAPPQWLIERCDGDAVEAAQKWPKTPRIQWRDYQTREPTDDEWQTWRRRWPNCNWAIITGKQIVVVDADSQEAIAWLEAGNITRPQRWVDTAHGRHYYYGLHASIDAPRNSAGKQRIDIRGYGGYVVAPGSVHITGVIYTEHRNPAWPDTSPDGLPTLTSADLAAINTYNRPHVAGDGRIGLQVPQSLVGAKVGEGQRNTALAASVGAWINDSIGLDQLRGRAHAWNRSLAVPLADGEVDTVVQSIIRTHMQRHVPVAVDVEPTTEVADYAPQAFVLPAEAEIPPRRFVAGLYAYPRGTVSTIVGAGGSAKSSLAIVECLAMASGRGLLHAPISEPVTVWLLNLEDPLEELQRRLAAAMKHYGLRNEHLGGRLLITSGMGQAKPFISAESTRSGTIIHRPVYDAVAGHIRRHAISAMHIDPFVSSHRVTENDNGAIDATVKAWAAVAYATDSCITLEHHLRKLSGRDADAEDARGGVALIGAVRLARVVNPMDADTAEKAGIPDERWRYFRTTDGKANLTPRSDRSTWYRLETVTLSNGGAGPGDRVGVVTPWTFPDPFEEITASDLARVMAALRTGEWKYDRRGKGNWVGNLIGQVCSIDTANPTGMSHVADLLRTWVENGALVVEERLDSNRNKRRFVVAGRMPE